MATHEMNFAREIADNVCFLKDGIVWEQGNPGALFSNASRPETRAFLSRVG
jgi:polar amino acid transport system ATP-binding protein